MWSEAVEYGFVSAGGGAWYTNTLGLLQPGARIWVSVPREGYVGVGEVVEAAQPIDTFTVRRGKGEPVRIVDLPLAIARCTTAARDPSHAERLVRVRWIKTVELEHAVKERGFFGNQNTVARPRTAKWDYTVARLKTAFGIDDGERGD